MLALALGAAAALHAPSSGRFLQPAQPRLRTAARLVAAPPLETRKAPAAYVPAWLSGLGGQALRVEASDVPSKREFREAIPARCFEKDTARSLGYAFQSVACTGACLALAPLIPLRWAFAPAWLAYGALTGTAATGLWVIAHECGHKAFSDNRRLQDAVGYVLHSLMLVPYFSWQRSHAVHHAHTNHITAGETHVPAVVDAVPDVENGGADVALGIARALGRRANGVYSLFLHLVIGWPAYLLWGATGGPKYGMSNHFIPARPFSKALWPASWPRKV